MNDKFDDLLGGGGFTAEEAIKGFEYLVEVLSKSPINPLLFEMRESLYPGEDWSKEKEDAWDRWNECNKNKDIK